MDYWIIIPVLLFGLSVIGTNFELWRLRKEVEQLKKKKSKKKK